MIRVRFFSTLLASILIFATAHSGRTHSQPDPPLKLADGVFYSVEYLPKAKWSVHTVTVDLTLDNISVRLGKGLDHISGLERVQSVMHRFDSVNVYDIALAGVNANFWKAGTNHPMGPTIIDGQILINEKYKNWSSVAISEDKKIYIDNFDISVEIKNRFGSIPLHRFNHRKDSTSLVVYTHFYGSTVPFIDMKKILLASADTLTDESEIENGLIAAALDSILSISPESGTLKLQFEYLKNPLANTIIPCIITNIDTGFVAIPKNGGVLSFGKGQFPLFFSLFVGDTFSLSTRISPAIPSPILHMTGGTPRLVRDGKISVEWQEEGLKKVRFVNGKYGRTGFGISEDGKKAILVTVEQPNRKKGKRGISLPDLAKLLLERGAYQGMNFDGGSSATMAIGGNTVSPPGGVNFSRKVSTSLLIVKRKGLHSDN